ncbi:hypothetical protein GOP47_0030248 [Adiantum capillus-veneris]|nr:hypothetical protein GOP47_0030248 [Adiantum capillus-veneris]
MAGGGGGGAAAAELLTEQEAAVYDRQIRVWGVEAQRRLSRGRILVIGMSNVLAELCKNIVLAGIGSLTLMEGVPNVSTIATSSFLVPAEQAESDQVFLTACVKSLKDFNPMVHVALEKGDLMEKSNNFLDNFDVVVVGRSLLNYRIIVNGLCRKRSQKIAFFSVDCRGPLGEIFVDLQTHSYVLKTKENEPHSVQKLVYCSLEESIAARWDKLPKKTAKLFYAMRIVEDFERSNSRAPGQVTFEDLAAILDARKSYCESQGVPETSVPEKLLHRLLQVGERELPPVCAIVGGILGQEVLKALSGKGEPLKNFFFFDPSDGKGIIEEIPRAEITPIVAHNINIEL